MGLCALYIIARYQCPRFMSPWNVGIAIISVSIMGSFVFEHPLMNWCCDKPKCCTRVIRSGKASLRFCGHNCRIFLIAVSMDVVDVRTFGNCTSSGISGCCWVEIMSLSTFIMLMLLFNFFSLRFFYYIYYLMLLMLLFLGYPVIVFFLVLIRQVTNPRGSAS